MTKGNPRMMRKLVVAALAALVVSTPAHARMATWKKMNYWHVQGDTATGGCFASSVYPNAGKVLTIAIGRDGEWGFMIQGVVSVRGEQYEAAMMGSNGSYGVLTGTGVGYGAVAFGGVTPGTIRSLGAMNRLTIANIGTFNMKGSAAAANEVWACHRALNEY